MKPKKRTVAVVAVVALGSALTAGCGDSTPPPKTAAAETSRSTPKRASNGLTPNADAVLSATSAPSAATELSGDAKAAYDRGFAAWSTGDLPAARDAFKDAISRASSAASPQYSLGCVLERLGDTQGALAAYRAAFTTNAKYDGALGAYALLLARTGHGSDAESFLAGKGAQDPDSVGPKTYLAEVKSIEGDSPGCQQLAQQVLAKSPDAKAAMVAIARDFYRNHKWDLARYALGAILDGADDGSIPPRDKDNPEALLIRGLIEREMGQRKEAIADFDLATSRRPDLFEAHVNLGEMKLEAGNATEAQSPLEHAVRFAPNAAIAHLDLGDCYRLLGRPADSKKELATALSLDSTLAGAHYDLGLLYLFSESVPGVSGPDDQLNKAIQELESYKSMRGAKTVKGPGDDVDELLSTAKRKQSELQLKQQAAATAPSAASASPTPPPASAAPATAPTPDKTKNKANK
ncbi:MAG TPA: tetratricopeptide repeat protein [Polyangiaceae bacterium]|nr:tetratricopeptide repeat protein [Polyangiaceae bacterium]